MKSEKNFETVIIKNITMSVKADTLYFTGLVVQFAVFWTQIVENKEQREIHFETIYFWKNIFILCSDYVFVHLCIVK